MKKQANQPSIQLTMFCHEAGNTLVIYCSWMKVAPSSVLLKILLQNIHSPEGSLLADTSFRSIGELERAAHDRNNWRLVRNKWSR